MTFRGFRFQIYRLRLRVTYGYGIFEKLDPFLGFIFGGMYINPLNSVSSWWTYLGLGASLPPCIESPEPMI